MKYRTLGSTGLQVSAVGVGTWQFGGEWGIDYSPPEVEDIFNEARNCGLNLIDTAECYGDHLSESLIGKAIQNDRDHWVLATKFGHHFRKPFDRSEPRTPEDVVKQLEDSLKALKTDRVELWQYHSWGDEQFFNEDVMAAVLECKKQGKVLHLGNSVGSNTNLKQVGVSRDMAIEAIQIIYNRLDRAPESQVFPSCIEQKLGVLARVPLASGYLSGKYKPGHQFDKNEVRGKWHKPEDIDAKLREVEQIKRDEVPQGVDMASWALAWVLQHPAVTCVIPGCKSAAQVKSNAAAVELDLVRDDHPQACAAPI